jgi:hypothetical protein
MWSEGNYSCDCARRRFFAKAIGEDDPDPGECGDGAFSVRIKLDNLVVYQDGHFSTSEVA